MCQHSNISLIVLYSVNYSDFLIISDKMSKKHNTFFRYAHNYKYLYLRIQNGNAIADGN